MPDPDPAAAFRCDDAVFYRRSLVCVLHDGTRFVARMGETGYMQFDETSWTIWEELEYPRTFSSLIRGLVALFQVDTETCVTETRGLLQTLLAAGLVEQADTPDANRNRYLQILKRSLVNQFYLEDPLRIHALRKGEVPAGIDTQRWLRRIGANRPQQLGAIRVSRRLGIAYNHYLDSPPMTLVGIQRLEQLERYAETLFREGIAGDFLEAGVWRGGASIFMRALQVSYGQADRVMWIADSFEGLPRSTAEPDLAIDFSKMDELKASLETVRENFHSFGLLDGNVRALKGWFADTLPGAPVRQIALLRLDGDLYSSTMETLEALYDRVSPGGYVVVDDYGALPMCRQAVDEFRARLAVTERLEQVDQYCVAWRKGR